MTAANVFRLRVAALGGVLVVLAFSSQRPLRAWLKGGSQVAAPSGGRAGVIDHYTCSMHPAVRQSGPGSCPLCGMALVSVSVQPHAETEINVDEASLRQSGVRSIAAAIAPLKLVFNGSGRITYDESSLVDVTVRVPGYVTKLFVDSVGQRVELDQPLFTFYSPELYTAQREFLAARGPAAVGGVRHHARERLATLGLSESQIDALVVSRDAAPAVTITAPRAGFAILKEVVEGAALSAGTRVFRIASLDKVWVEADVYDRELAEVHAGQTAKVTLDYVPGRVYSARVVYVYPYMETSARTGRVRLAIENASDGLRPGMFASVQFEADAGARLQVPTSAVLYTGPRRLVFVNLGAGRFRPQEIRIGHEANGMYEVTAGLEPGQLVAASGTFLLAAEARINSLANYWEADAISGARPVELPPSAASTAAFSCPMHPEVQSATPGKCPKCGMPLVPTSQDHPMKMPMP